MEHVQCVGSLTLVMVMKEDGNIEEVYHPPVLWHIE